MINPNHYNYTADCSDAIVEVVVVTVYRFFDRERKKLSCARIA
jgi:hypothetical protein